MRHCLLKACRFDLSIFDKAGCSKSNDYGFKNGTPCVILSLNRMIGWKPDPYENNSVPDVIADRYERGFVTILCEGTVTFFRAAFACVLICKCLRLL